MLYLDGALCLEHLLGKAATVARFKYRLMASVGDGFNMDKADVQCYKIMSRVFNLFESLTMMISQFKTYALKNVNLGKCFFFTAD